MPIGNTLFCIGPELFCVASRLFGIDNNPHIHKIIQIIETRQRVNNNVRKNKRNYEYDDYEIQRQEKERQQRQESDYQEYMMKKEKIKNRLEEQEFSDLGYRFKSSYYYYDE